MSKVLMLNIRGRPNPFAYQVPDDVFKRFKHLEDVELFDPKTPDYIEDWINQNAQHNCHRE